MTLLVLVAGPSQSGKNTLMLKFLETHHYAKRIPTATSRNPRPSEVDGVDKFFLTRADFEEHPENFLESVTEHGNYYGIVKSTFLEWLEKHPLCFMDLEVRGVEAVLDYIEEQNVDCQILTIFVCPDNFDTIEERILKLNDGNAENRIASAKREFKFKDNPMFNVTVSSSCSIQESFETFSGAINDAYGGLNE